MPMNCGFLSRIVVCSSLLRVLQTARHLRAFATEDGHLLWDVDTAHDFQTVNGVRGKGGSMDGAGPVIAGGMVFVNSGYARNGAMSGNLLLAFGPE